MRSLLSNLFGKRDASQPAQASARPDSQQRRVSSGLEQLIAGFADAPGLHLLDLGAVSAATHTILGEMGHRITTEDILHGYEDICGTSATPHAREVSEFLDTYCNFRDVDFDGGLLWDTLHYIPATVRSELVHRLYRTLRPGSFMLAYFYTTEGQLPSQARTFHIVSPREVEATPRRSKLKPVAMSIREVDQLFAPFTGLKYLLSRGNLREVLIKR